MPKPKGPIKVNKIPITSSIPDHAPNFPKLDNLQLEFLENKDKLLPKYQNESLPDPVEVQRQIMELSEPNEPEYEEEEGGGLDLGDEGYEDDGGVYEETTEDWGEDEESVPSKGQKKEVPLTHKEQQDKDAQDKKDILFQFHVLREAYKDDVDKIPDVDEYMDVEKLREELSRTRKLLSIDRNAQKGKIALVVLLVIMEAIGRYFRLPMKGFVQGQYAAMDEYKHLLIELGLKYASGEESSWPVEVRLFLAVAGNAVMFTMGNVFVNGMESQGTGLGSIIGDMIFPKRSSPSQGTPSTPRTMEGPSVDAEDFQESSSEEEEEPPPPPPRRRTTRTKINV
jgi:hypothetical protein